MKLKKFFIWCAATVFTVTIAASHGTQNASDYTWNVGQTKFKLNYCHKLRCNLLNTFITKIKIDEFVPNNCTARIEQLKNTGDPYWTSPEAPGPIFVNAMVEKDFLRILENSKTLNEQKQEWLKLSYQQTEY